MPNNTAIYNYANNGNGKAIIKDQFHVLEDFSYAKLVEHGPEDLSKCETDPGTRRLMHVILRNLSIIERFKHGQRVEPKYRLERIPIDDNYMHGHFHDGFRLHYANSPIKQKTISKIGCWEFFIILIGVVGVLVFIGGAIDTNLTRPEFPGGSWWYVWLGITWIVTFTVGFFLLHKYWGRLLRSMSDTVSNDTSAEIVLNYGNLFPVLAYNGKYDGWVPIFGAGVTPSANRDEIVLRFEELGMSTEDVFGHGSKRTFLKHFRGLSPSIFWGLGELVDPENKLEPIAPSIHPWPDTKSWKNQIPKLTNDNLRKDAHLSRSHIVFKRTILVEDNDKTRGILRGFLVLEIPIPAISEENPRLLLDEGKVAISDPETLVFIDSLERDGWIEAVDFTFQEWNLTEKMRSKIKQWHERPDTRPFELLQLNGKTHLDAPFTEYESELNNLGA